jgi:hypothetical protein
MLTRRRKPVRAIATKMQGTPTRYELRLRYMMSLLISQRMFQPREPLADDLIDIENDAHPVGPGEQMDVDDAGGVLDRDVDNWVDDDGPEGVAGRNGVEHPQQAPIQDPPPAQQPQAARPRRHGYASIEVHPNAAQVLRWEYIDEPAPSPDPEDSLRQKKYFELCEWLMHVPISDEACMAYLNLELVGFILHVSFLCRC